MTGPGLPPSPYQLPPQETAEAQWTAPGAQSTPPWGPPSAPEPQRTKPLSKAAVTSLAFGVIGGMFLGLIFGGVGLAATGKGGDRRGRGLAWAGIVLSVVWVVAIAGVVAWRVSERADRGNDGSVQSAGTSTVLDLQRGDCLKNPSGSAIVNVDVLPCTQPHDAQVFAVIQPYTSDTYDATVIAAATEQGCRNAAAGAVSADQSYDLLYFYPKPDGWHAGQRNSVCMLRSDTPLTSSVVTG